MKEILTKKCSMCGKTKEVGEFYKDRSRKNGRSWCKICCENKKSEYYHKNQDECNKKLHEWQNKNRDKIKKYNKKQYDLCPDLVAMKVKRWRDNNPQKVKEYNQKSICGLKSSYIRPLIKRKYNIKYTDINSEIIEAKRKQIKAIRLLARWKEVIA